MVMSISSLPKDIDIEAIKRVNVLTARLTRRRQEWEEAIPFVSAQSSLSFTKVWKETEGLPLDLRWGKAFAKIMQDTPVIIRDGELIVGSQTKYIRGVDLIAANDPLVVLEQLKGNTLKRKLSEKYAEIEDEDRRLLEEDAQYWADHLPPNYERVALLEELGEAHLDLLADRGRVFESRNAKRGLRIIVRSKADITLDLLNEGLGGIIKRVRDELGNMSKLGCQLETESRAGYGKYILLKSMLISLQAVIDWAHRYADLTRSLADKESDPLRKVELYRISEHCEWVPENPPRSFWEALQFVRFVHLAFRKEGPDRGSIPLGRIDQYLYPYYEKDINDGKITRQEAAELLGNFWLATREAEILQTVTGLHTSQGALLVHTTLGGQNKEGRDATNELTWLILEVARQLKVPEPDIYIRYHDGMNCDFLKYALECNRELQGGNPAFFNDNLGTARFLARGVKLEYAIDWSAVACMMYKIAGSDGVTPPLGILNDAKIFELTLYNGFDPRTGKQLGLKTGDVTKFNCIEQFYEAFEKQIDYFMDAMRKDYFIRRSIEMEIAPNSGYTLAICDGYITRGLGPAKREGRNALSEVPWAGERGLVDVADCMVAIKYLVFDKKKITMAELLEALRANWEGKEEVRQECLRAPKYGNDDDYADDIYNYMSLKMQEIMLKRLSPFTGERPFLFKPAGIGHVITGEVVGALPNGRIPWSPVNDGGTSAMPGMDIKGPTALVNSATKVDHAWENLWIVHNMKFSRNILNTDEKLEKVIALMKTFFARGGWHIQFNIHSAEDLIDARKNPEKWKHLLVRVAGFCAYFVELAPSVQDEIISRTLHEI